jgi:HK97 gp10 family phage protein
MTGSSLDVSGWLAGLDKLGGPARVSLARSMAVAGGQVLRDEAKRQAPVDDGTLRDSIYLAYKDGKSNDKQVVYSVTWNSKKAPHGHLLEFGHWQPYVVRKLPNGDWFTTKEKLATPKFTAAKPFLRPALDIAKGRAAQAMLERGRERLQTILSGGDDD